MKLYGVKTCTSCKKAVAFLDENGIEYEYIKINDNIPQEKIEYWLNFVVADKLFNPRSKAYREFDLKGKDLTKASHIKKLWTDNSLIKRPVIEHGLNGEEKLCVGFNEKEFNELFIAS